ncbi:MAG: hypothetical protein A3A85_08345 [Deltaproteobacteria bacterium RIFCSPLOWO2_01_FULL_42_9]|nr:MAG: hypothetical protein A3A85_08345 [Deltaproteobacteria bacterium RIFCSPLOWO2_01_FULL_42_9]
MKRITFITFFAFTLLITGRGMAGETITIAGDPCSAPLAKELGSAFTKKTGIHVDVSSFSCQAGIDHATEGKADIGVNTKNELSSDLQGTDVTHTVIAKSPIVLIVNKKNPVKNLTYEQVQGIFSGKIKNWKDVSDTDMEIKNVMLMPCVTHAMSQQAALYGQDIAKIIPEKKGNPSTNTNILVAENEGAIGQQIYGYESKDVKVLAIDGLLPDKKTLPVKYKFYQDYNVVTRWKPQGKVKEFIDFALSDEGISIIKSMKHIPVNQ